MSKVGIKPIAVAKAKVEVAGSAIKITGDRHSFDHKIPSLLTAGFSDQQLSIKPADGVEVTKKVKMIWGTHRALLANKIKGVETGFESTIKIVGLGYKAVVQGEKMNFTLGYSHKIDLTLDKEVSVEVDKKTGQLLTLRSHDKAKLGHVCALIRALRPPEPYKGTGIFVNNEVILRKAGKAKA